jgi:hypothetical protein
MPLSRPLCPHRKSVGAYYTNPKRTLLGQISTKSPFLKLAILTRFSPQKPGQVRAKNSISHFYLLNTTTYDFFCITASRETGTVQPRPIQKAKKVPLSTFTAHSFSSAYSGFAYNVRSLS